MGVSHFPSYNDIVLGGIIRTCFLVLVSGWSQLLVLCHEITQQPAPIILSKKYP